MAKKIVIDAGHGGSDPGAIGNGITEKDLTLKISEYLHNRFNALGIPNEMTRTSDVTLSPKDRPVKAQSFYGNSPDVILLSNHINAGGGDGAEVIYALRNKDTLAKKIADEFVKSGQNVRKYYQRRLPSDPSKDYYYILRDTPNNESLIVEYGFLDSTGDDPTQLKNNWEELAEGVVRAVASYAGVPYVPIAGSNSYVVKSGDTLWKIAREYGVSVDELKEKNNLSSNSLTVGQVLIIPTASTGGGEVSGEYYIVKSGDSLWKIANQYNMTVSELMALNNLSSSSLSIGQRLRVSGSNSVPSGSTYIVKSGDSLWKIANQYNTTVANLKSLNNLTSDSLSVGQVLVVPSTANKVYTVQSGDSLWKIANQYDTSVDELKRLNNLTSNVLSIGQKLIVP